MFDKQYMEIPVSELNWVLTGGPTYADSVYENGVIEPILVAEWQGNLFLMAGNRRVASIIVARARAEADGTLPDRPWLESIGAMVYQNVSPFNQAVWSLIENEERSENLILTWQTIQQLQDAGRWEEVRQMLKINKARVERFKLLDHADPNLIQAYLEGRISESNLLAAARLRGRQKSLVEALDRREGKDKRITSQDIIGAKYAQNQATLAKLNHLDLDVPETQPVQKLFIVLDNDLTPQRISTDFQVCLTTARQNGWKVYKLEEV